MHLQIGGILKMPYSNIEQQRKIILTNVKDMLGRDDVSILSQNGGGNSVVYCVQVGDVKYAVKSYPPYAPGKRDRLAAEVKVYQFLNEHKVESVPHLIQFHDEHRLLMMDWIDGEVPLTYSLNDVEQAINFIDAISHLNTLSEARHLPMAAEACLSLSIIINQVSSRLQRLQSAADAEPELAAFLTNEFVPVFMASQERARDGYRAAKLNPDAELTYKKQSLIPADFGFHNTIRDSNGNLHFFDFDYFGWDDPVKLLADILWHPKMMLTDQQKQRFIGGIANVYQTDTTFLTRFQYTLELFGLRWTLIFLNEFLPEFWQNRQHAAVHASQAEAKINQLKRARATLQTVQNIGSQYDIISETSI